MDRGICCCHDDSICYEKAENVRNCEPSCDIWLDAAVSHCTEPSPCSFSTSQLMDPSDISTYDFTEKFVFVLSKGVSPDEVRVAKNICIHH